MSCYYYKMHYTSSIPFIYPKNWFKKKNWMNGIISLENNKSFRFLWIKQQINSSKFSGNTIHSITLNGLINLQKNPVFFFFLFLSCSNRNQQKIQNNWIKSLDHFFVCFVFTFKNEIVLHTNFKSHNWWNWWFNFNSF